MLPPSLTVKVLYLTRLWWGTPQNTKIGLHRVKTSKIHRGLILLHISATYFNWRLLFCIFLTLYENFEQMFGVEGVFWVKL